MNNLKELLWCLTVDEKHLQKGVSFNRDNYGFVDNGADVLAVVHLDTVFNPKKHFVTPIVTKRAGDTLINHVNLDDRLGLWMLLYEIPSRFPDIKYDILFTTDEEIGASTSQNFVTDKKYNWIFQFDRHGQGGNVVMYDYETKQMSSLLSSYGYDVQRGTFSDICCLEHLGCKGFNFSCAYINEHTNNCITRSSWIDVALNMFADFYNDNHTTWFGHEQTSRAVGSSRWWNGYKGSGYGYWKDVTPGLSEDEGFTYTAPKIGTENPGEQCSMCECELLSSERKLCTTCAKDIENLGWAYCDGCATMFATEDLIGGFCYDCR